jgi:predicted flap endonuclease-1-like 5' DNA nuclease
MFWKTCLDHSLEILIALVGSGLLGYFLSRVFGHRAQHENLRAEYESQLNSFHTRVSQQDADLRAAQALQSNWQLEKERWEHSQRTLQEKIDHYEHQLANNATPAIDEKLPSDLVLQVEKAESKSKELETEVLQLRAELDELRKAPEEKIKEADLSSSALQKALDHSNQLEQDYIRQKDVYEQSLDQKNQEIQRLTTEDNAIHSVPERNAESDPAWQQAQQEIERLRLELAEKNSIMSSPADETVHAGLEERIKILSAENQHLVDQINQLNESNTAGMAALTETRSLLHRAENEMNHTSQELGRLHAIEASLQQKENAYVQLQQVAREWEARWKDSASEAEHFKVALHQATHEADQLRQRISFMESELLMARNTLETQAQAITQLPGQSAEDSKKEEIINLKDQLENRTKEWIESNQLLDQKNHALGQADLRIQELEQALSQKNQDWNLTVLALESEENRKTEDAKNLHILREELHHSKAEQATLGHYLETKNHQLEEADSRYQDLLGRFNLLQGQLADLQKSHAIAQDELNQKTAQIQQLSDAHGPLVSEYENLKSTVDQLSSTAQAWEQKHLELSHRYNTIQLQYLESEKSIDSYKNLIHELELRYLELQGKWKENQEKEPYQHAIYQELATSHSQVEKELHDLRNQYDTLLAEWNVTHQTNQALEFKWKDLEASHQEKLRQLNELNQVVDSKIQDHELSKKELGILQNQVASLEENIRLEAQNKAKLEIQLKELSSKFNTVQYQLADLQRVHSHQQEQNKKSVDQINAKYKAEVLTWQNRLQEKSKDQNQKINIIQKKHLKESADLLRVNKSLQKDIVKWKSKADAKVTPILLSNTKRKTQGPATKTQKINNTKDPDWSAVSALMQKRVRPDDLQIIEGIGPKINRYLQKANIKSWATLADTSPKAIETILHESGNQFNLADPATWPLQARLAADQKWQELKSLQAELIAGRRLSTAGAAKKPKKRQSIKEGSEILGTRITKDDLKLIEGIGPKLEKILLKAGINTWKKLANSNKKQLQEILDKAGARFNLADPSSWARQSHLAATGAWTRLKTLQEQLKAGK